ncbi:condensation domain-containing protein, partial [Ruminobacter sp.]|uniref:condensation domain-containing protein n=1 Tax=Ruminobacter sp. TaxID=2774296 RepID=UPI00386BB255
MLRTEITADGRQRILPHRPCGTIETTATANAEKAKEALNSWWDMLNGQDASYPYAINAFTYGADMVRMALAFSYMNLDGFSIKMIIRELSDAYMDPEAYAAMRPVNLSFRDYVLSCPEDENALKKAYAYWDERIEELPPAPQLPVITNPDRITKSHFVRVAHTINHEDLAKLKAKTKKYGLTPSAVMLHAYAEVLCLYSGTNGVTINMTLFDRQNVHEDIYRVAGDFTSLVPVAYRPAVGRSFAEGTAKLAEALAEALDHREFSSIHIQRELSKRKGLSMASLPVVFTSTLGIADDLLSGDSEKDFLTITDGGLSETPQVWLDHQLYEKKDGLYLSWDYVSELYDSKLIEEMFGCYRNLIQTLISEDWQQPIASVLPADTVRTRAIVNTTSAPITNLLLAERIFVNSVANPDDTAIFYGDGEISYGRLYGSLMRVAGMLVQNGVKPLDRVAVSVARGPLQIISVLAVLAAGAVYVPVSVTQPSARKNRILSRALIKTVLTTEPFEPADGISATFLDPMEASHCKPLDKPVRVSPDSAAYIIFTSGST